MKCENTLAAYLRHKSVLFYLSDKSSLSFNIELKKQARMTDYVHCVINRLCADVTEPRAFA